MSCGGRWTHGTGSSGDDSHSSRHGGHSLGSRRLSPLLVLFFPYLLATSWRQVRGAARGSEASPSHGRGPRFLGGRRRPGSLRWLRYSPSVSGPPPALLLCPRRPARKTGKRAFLSGEPGPSRQGIPTIPALLGPARAQRPAGLGAQMATETRGLHVGLLCQRRDHSGNHREAASSKPGGQRRREVLRR